MRVFLAGATGAVGRRLLPALRARGYEVIAMTRSHDRAEQLRSAGAEPVVADALDRDAVVRALTATKPDVIIHQLTALTGVSSFRDFDREFATTNRLRTEGTDHLLAGARAAGVRRIVAQSFGAWIYDSSVKSPATEADPLEPRLPKKLRPTLEAIVHLERAVVEGPIPGIALRYGFFYGPGTSLGAGGDVVELVRQRKVPVMGNGAGVWSLAHIDDAASAAIAAIEQGAPGVYNVCDDDPAPVAQWLPELARALHAKSPMRVPVWLGRLAAGEVGVHFMTRIRGMSNANARRELRWEPHWRSWRDGFRDGLGAAHPRFRARVA